VARKKKPKQHFPTSKERDERTRIDTDPEEALKILLGTANDRELDEDEQKRS
jgi:hypothetical protein